MAFKICLNLQRWEEDDVKKVKRNTYIYTHIYIKCNKITTTTTKAIIRKKFDEAALKDCEHIRFCSSSYIHISNTHTRIIIAISLLHTLEKITVICAHKGYTNNFSKSSCNATAKVVWVSNIILFAIQTVLSFSLFYTISPSLFLCMYSYYWFY